MGRKRPPIQETLAWEIFEELLSFVDTEQAIPCEHAIWASILKPKGYDLTLGQFRYQFNMLKAEGYIQIDRKSGAVKIPKDRLIVPPERVRPLKPEGEVQVAER